MKNMFKLATLLLSIASCVLSKPPNIVLFLVDDQDIQLNGMTALPKTYDIFGTNGIEFKNAFASTPVCCVSRGSILTGRYVHNHPIRNNSIYGGCGSGKWIHNDEPFTYAAYLTQQHNYRTFFAGKYLNLYGETDEMPYTHVPQGWTDWYGLIGDAVYYDYGISIRGEKREYHGDTGDDNYLPYVMRDFAISFLEDIAENNSPFLLNLAFPAAHKPWIPPDRYLYVYEDTSLTAPTTPNFNYFNEDGTNNDKGPVLRMQTPMTNEQRNMADEVYRGRHGTLLAVDDIIDEIYKQISEIGELENTYFIYTSDHGFHMGQYGMWFGKKLLYETDLRIPFYICGPNIMGGQITSKTALTIDIGPTILDLALGFVPDTMDGESLVPYFNLDRTEEEHIYVSRQTFLVEYYGETDIYNEVGADVPYNEVIIECQSETEAIDEISCDLWNNTYQCIRSIDGSKGDVCVDNHNIGEIFCKYTCYDKGYNAVECEQYSVESKGEYYNLNTDPWQLTNTYVIKVVISLYTVLLL